MSTRKRRTKGGFSYAEMLLVMLILALCSGFIGDAMSFGLSHLRRRTQCAYAVILQDTLCAAVRNDLEYATEYHSGGHSFARTVRDYENNRDIYVRTWYGTGQWRTGNPESYYDENALQWREIHDETACYGQIIRKSALIDGAFFDSLAPPESYSGYGEAESGLYAGMDMDLFLTDEDAQKIDRFIVTIRIYDGPDSGADILTQRKFTVFPVQRVPYKD